MIIIKKGDITEEQCDAIVNPANSMGYMGGGVAHIIKIKGGKEIEDEAVSKAPIPVGQTVATTAGNLKCKFVIHSPTMERPAMKIPAENVRLATKAALKLANELGLKSIALPGMGTGTGGVKPEVAAKIMVEEAKKFKDLDIILVAYDDLLYNAFKKYAEG